MSGFRVGDKFYLCGPHRCWLRQEGWSSWQPRAWSSYPGDDDSYAIPWQEENIDFWQIFRILELWTTNSFVSAKVAVGRRQRHVWINIEKHGIPWAIKVEEEPDANPDRAFDRMIPDVLNKKI